MSTIEDALALSDDELLRQLGSELWREKSHATPPNDEALRSQAKLWLRANLPRAREAVCGNAVVLELRAGTNEVLLVGAVADILATSLGFPAPATVATLIIRIGLDKLCGGEVPASAA